MQTIIEKKYLVSALKSACRVAPRRGNIQILMGVRIQAGAGCVAFSATDLDIEETIVCPADVDAAGVAIVPALSFSKIAAQLPDGPVLLETATREIGEVLTISAGASEFEFTTRAAEDWPQMKTADVGSFTLPAATLRHMLEKTRYAISTEETRFYLNGVCLDYAGRPDVLAAVATDGHRLALVETARPEGVDVLKKLDERNIIIPRATCLELLKAFAKEKGDITITAHKSATTHLVAFSAGAVRIISKLIDGSFPDYRRVIPADERDVMTVDRGALKSGLARVIAGAADKQHAVKFTVNGHLVLSVVNPETGTMREDMPSEWTRHNGKEFDIGFNGKYVGDMLDTIDGERVQFHIDDERGPVRIIDTGDASVLHVLMPMRV